MFAIEQSESKNKFEQVVQKIEPYSKLLRAWELEGGASAQVTALEIARPDGHTQKLIVRQHGEVDLAHDPHIAADEFKLLQLIRASGVAAPTPFYFDESGEIFPTPYIVIEYMEGEPEFAPTDLTAFLQQLAAQLSKIHSVDCVNLDLDFLPKPETRYAAKLRDRPPADESADKQQIRDDKQRIREALLSVWPLPQRNHSVLLHGDFWPGNVLWQAGQLVAVLDWEDAAFGDPLADVANTRLEVLWALGVDAMQQFTRYYQSLNRDDFTDLPYWDLCAALRPSSNFAAWAPSYALFGRQDITSQAMRAQHHWFITQAFENLSVT